MTLILSRRAGNYEPLTTDYVSSSNYLNSLNSKDRVDKIDLLNNLLKKIDSETFEIYKKIPVKHDMHFLPAEMNLMDYILFKGCIEANMHGIEEEYKEAQAKKTWCAYVALDHHNKDNIREFISSGLGMTLKELAEKSGGSIL